MATTTTTGAASSYEVVDTKTELGMLKLAAGAPHVGKEPLLGGEIIGVSDEQGKLTLAVRFDTAEMVQYAAETLLAHHERLLATHQAQMWPKDEASAKRAKPDVELESPWDAEKNVLSVRVFAEGEQGAHVWVGAERAVGSVRDLVAGKKVTLQLCLPGMWHRKSEYVCGIQAVLAHAWVTPPECPLYPFALAEDEQLAKRARALAPNRQPPALRDFAPPADIELNTSGTATYSVAWLREALTFHAQGTVVWQKEDRVKLQLDDAIPAAALGELSTRLLAQLRAALPDQFRGVQSLRPLCDVADGALWVNLGARNKPAFQWARDAEDGWDAAALDAAAPPLERARMRAVVEVAAVWISKDRTSAGYRARITHFQRLEEGDGTEAPPAFPFALGEGQTLSPDAAQAPPADDALPPADAAQYRVDAARAGKYANVWHKTGMFVRVEGEVVREMQGKLCLRLASDEDAARVARLDEAQEAARVALAPQLPVETQPLLALADEQRHIYPKINADGRAPSLFWATTEEQVVVPAQLAALLPLEGKRVTALLEVRGMWLAREGDDAGRTGHNVVLRHAWLHHAAAAAPAAPGGGGFPPGFQL